ncbi:MAG TPA: radical SAM protein [Candidatus Bathyarchaeia archaeon]|nr:radical SAM protein [Candidatus Bathyarchaeia archaeon]
MTVRGKAVTPIKKIAFVYLTQASGATYVTDDVAENIQNRPLLGLQYLCAVCERRGVSTMLFDQRIAGFDEAGLLKTAADCDLIGFYCSDPQEDKVKQYGRWLKAHGAIPILVGGPSTLENTSFLDHGCDWVIHGEGERTIGQILDYYEGRRIREQIKGVSYKKDGEIITAPPQDLIENLDGLPFPDRSKIDIYSYHDYLLFGMKKPYITLMASRGCPYRCSFCVSYKLWNCRYRQRSVGNVLAEIDDAVARYGVKYIGFQDDVFGGSNAWIEAFCEGLLNRPYRIRWMAILHPFSIRKDTDRILGLMKKAGCDALSFGLQSADSEILKRAGRSPDEPRSLMALVRAADRIGLVTYVMYIFGLPGETRETIKTTTEYSIRCASALVTYNVFYSLRGSEIENQYQGRPVCDINQDELVKLSMTASRKFYLSFGTMRRIVYFIAKNPGWLLRAGFSMASVLARAGLIRGRKLKAFDSAEQRTVISKRDQINDESCAFRC